MLQHPQNLNPHSAVTPKLFIVVVVLALLAAMSLAITSDTEVRER